MLASPLGLVGSQAAPQAAELEGAHRRSGFQGLAQDVAFAVRVSWGRDDTLIIYRSLGPSAPRSFLGYQTKARFLLGRFTNEGNVEPLLSVD